ncbi:MAG: cytochrome c biogenesis heme-transporting ATPase CcmA [Pseudomonadales bacterium]|nr:cytochrome c biogenesis heme-transporting ATPase CcmA [Pseudomonadales bacterium]
MFKPKHRASDVGRIQLPEEKTSTSSQILAIRNLSCQRDDRELFVDLSFDVSAGEVVQVAGPNGSGKTTLLRILCGLMSDFTGDILWCGQPVKKCWEDFSSQLAFIGHAAGIKPSLTAEENLAWLVDIHGQHNIGEEDISDALTKVGLRGYEDVQTQQLSAGQKRRVGLARLYVEQAFCWILDEPFTAIDQQGVAELEKLIFDHAEKGGMVILTTHHQLNVTSGRFKKIQLGEAVVIPEGEGF